MAWDDGLEDPHLSIASADDQSVFVLAGPGTGKTFALMRRVARLLEEGLDPSGILAVTFTRTAAKDLREQLEALGVEGAERVRATTLHALCYGALSQENAFDQTGRTARPLLSYEIDALIADLSDQFGGRTDVKERLAAYEAGWARLQRDDPGWAPSQDDQTFETSLLVWLQYHRAMLIGELVPLSLRHILANPAVNLFDQFDHVLVDEFQDLNKADQALVAELASNSALTVIGDDNQSIYSFRYANPQGIRDFPVDHPETVQFQIEECRRCPPNIVALSNALIAHDPDSLRPEPLLSDPGRDDAVLYVVQHPTQAEEADTVADFIQHYLRENPETPPGQILVLSPRRFMGLAVKQGLIDRGLQSLSYFYEDELKSTDSAEGFCLLTLLTRPGDRAALRGWLGLRSQTRRSKSYKRLKDHCSANDLEPRDVLESMRTGDVRIAHTQALRTRYDLLLERLAQLDGMEGLDLIDALWPPDLEGVDDLRRVAQSLALEAPNSGELLGLLHQEITQPELPGGQDDIIRVMSLHKSKGLTAKVVVVVGCVAGALPTIDDALPPAIQDARLSEQRRLFYVAITRAADVLVLSGATTMTLADAMRSGVRHAGFVRGQLGVVRVRATPFLAEMGDASPRPITGAEWRQTAGF